VTRNNANLGEFARYAAVSAVGFAVDFVTLWILSSRLQIPTVGAVTMSFLLGGVCVYLLSLRYVFAFRRLGNVVIESTSFIALGLVGLAANLAIVSFCTEYLQLAIMLSKLFASGVTLVLNYVLRRITLFSPQTADPPIL
jgi:putative flippase GtrA